MSFEEALRRPGHPAPKPTSEPKARARPTAAVAPSGPVEGAGEGGPSAPESLALRAELARFAGQAREVRAQSRRGSRMPAEQEENWQRLLEAVDVFLERPAEKTVALDVARARVAAEAELEMDAKAFGDLSPALAERVLDRVHRLALRMTEVRRLGVRPKRSVTAFDWPVEPVVVTSLFGRRVHPIHGTWRVHSGLDLDTYPGQRVSAAAGGTVVRAGWNGAHGLQVEVEHAPGVLTRYSHLAMTLVEPGAIVSRGDALGLAGKTGATTGVHLHFEVWRNGRPVDPLEALAGVENENEMGVVHSGRRPAVSRPRKAAPPMAR